MESNELQSVLDLHAEELKNAREKSQSIFHDLSTSDTFPESVVLDHNYAKAWNLHPEADHVRPAKILFMKGVLFNPIENVKGEEEIDIEMVEPKLLPAYDIPRAKNGMKECERFCNLNQDDSDLENWEEKISKVTWSAGQKSLFDKVLKSLYSERLALLANQHNSNEPVLRRLAVDKMASRFRTIFGSISWDMTLLHWLHQVLCDNLPHIYLAQYLDILQTLKSKAPSLVDKMLSGSKNVESLQHLLKRPWDPISSYLNQNKVKRLPKNPLIVWTPGDPAYSCVGLSRRMKFWHTQFSNLGKLITVNPQVNPGVTIGESLEAIITAVRYEVMELKLNFPSRPIILVGWTIGALIACQVALFEPINAIVCLGFPLTGVNGSRGDLDDPLLENRTPTLFVIGQKASMCSVDDIEDFRERMRAESGLVVIGGADDHLRVCRMKKQLEGINQNIVDRCIVDEMYNFLSTILNQPPVNYSDIIIDKGKFEAPKRKRKSSAMIDPPYPDPTIKKPRNKRNSGFPFVSFSGNVSPSSPGSSTTETSSTTSSTCDNFMEKVFKSNGRSGKPQISSTSLLNLEEMKRKRLMAPPNGNGSSFTPIDLPPPEKEDKASFFSQQLGLPVISPSLASTAASSLVTTSGMNLTSSVPRALYSNQSGSVPPFTTMPQMSQPTFTNSCMTTSSSSAGGSGRLVLPKGNSPPGLSLNIGSLSSLSSFRQTGVNANPTSVAPVVHSSPKLMGVTRNIRPKMQNQILPASSTINPLYGKRLLPSTTTSSIILTPRVVSNSQPTSNLSFLTMANPMLSNILGSNMDTMPTLKSTLSSSNQSSYDAPSLPAPLNLSKTSESERVRTYLKAPQRTTNIVRTTTYVKGSPNKPKEDLINLVSPSSNDKPSPLIGSSYASSTKSISNSSATTTVTKSNGARKLQVITFLKPPPISNSANKEVKTSTSPKTIVSQSPNATSCKLSSPENASGALRLISSAIRVAEQKNYSNSGAVETDEEPSQKISLAQLSSDFQSEYLRSVCKPSPAVQEELNVPKVQNVESEPSASISQVVIDDMKSLDSGSEVKLEEEVTANETEMAVQSLMMEPITTDSAPITFVTSSTGVVDSAITDRLSHLSAGTQEAILALTQLSELA